MQSDCAMLVNSDGAGRASNADVVREHATMKIRFSSPLKRLLSRETTMKYLDPSSYLYKLVLEVRSAVHRQIRPTTTRRRSSLSQAPCVELVTRRERANPDVNTDAVL